MFQVLRQSISQSIIPEEPIYTYVYIYKQHRRKIYAIQTVIYISSKTFFFPQLLFYFCLLWFAKKRKLSRSTSPPEKGITEGRVIMHASLALRCATRANRERRENHLKPHRISMQSLSRNLLLTSRCVCVLFQTTEREPRA